eukprot:CAMPEP_0201586370 /NCGR_PEP_ID=MMETSP0190_2-20130828/132028_1 /ASSEMBLY_ACC=CAM_ASM_000263 /TAXON_ID=37353 /ORGANISM="Rosalina sp." /LENGTH=98 /DNA_ID=CAMNT_0048034239 /DNA_START=21 /DNA_END=313 /DNA_ORIENTATION=+
MTLNYMTTVTVSNRELNCEIDIDTVTGSTFELNITGIRALLDDLEDNVRGNLSRQIGSNCKSSWCSITTENRRLKVAMEATVGSGVTDILSGITNVAT